MDRAVNEKSRSDEAWREIESLLSQVRSLSASASSASEFFQKSLDLTVTTLAAVGGSVWLVDGESPLRLLYAAGLEVLESDDLSAESRQYKLLLQATLRSGEPQAFLPHTRKTGVDGWENPTDFLLLMVPIYDGQTVGGVLELVQRPTESPAVQRGNTQILSAIAKLAADFLHRQELNELRDYRKRSEELEKFAGQIHDSLDLGVVGYQVVNETRRLLDCDRVTLLVRRGRRFRVQAISGVDTFDRRAGEVGLLEQLADSVASSGEVVWYSATTTDVTSKLDQQVRQYTDHVGTHLLVVIPLEESCSDRDMTCTSAGSKLVLECFESGDWTVSSSLLARVTDQVKVAVNNAARFDRLPCPWLLRRMSRSSWMTRVQRLPRALTIVLAGLGLMGVLIAVPSDFTIRIDGRLQPEVTRDVFAPLDGQILDLSVKHDDQVAVGDVLLSLTSSELELEFQKLRGEYDTAQKRLLSVETARLSVELTAVDAIGRSSQLTAEDEELRELLLSKERQLKLLREEMGQLQVRSPIGGRVLTWDPQRILAGRPVQRGQVLLTVADVDGPWVAELSVPENRIGYVLRTQLASEEAPAVVFSLSSNTGVVYHGQVRQIARRTEVTEGSSVPVVIAIVDFDGAPMPHQRPGAAISAKIYCGRRAIGYVWCHDLIETLRGWWLW